MEDLNKATYFVHSFGKPEVIINLNPIHINKPLIIRLKSFFYRNTWSADAKYFGLFIQGTHLSFQGDGNGWPLVRMFHVTDTVNNNGFESYTWRPEDSDLMTVHSSQNMTLALSYLNPLSNQLNPDYPALSPTEGYWGCEIDIYYE